MLSPMMARGQVTCAMKLPGHFKLPWKRNTAALHKTFFKQRTQNLKWGQGADKF